MSINWELKAIIPILKFRCVVTFLKVIKGFLNVVPPSGSTTFKEAFLFGGGNTQRTKGTNKDIKNIFLAFGGLIFLKSVMIKTSKI